MLCAQEPFAEAWAAGRGPAFTLSKGCLPPAPLWCAWPGTVSPQGLQLVGALIFPTAEKLQGAEASPVVLGKESSAAEDRHNKLGTHD